MYVRRARPYRCAVSSALMRLTVHPNSLSKRRKEVERMFVTYDAFFGFFNVIISLLML